MEEYGLDSEAIQYHQTGQYIGDASDGVKAFTGIITEILAGNPSTILIDEPEAYLHPSVAQKLGYELSRAATQTDKTIFAATHSAPFTMGCIQSGAPANIIRLTYRNGVATARVLPSDRLLELMRHPLLRSTGVLSALFYEFVVVAESDADRAFYQEINERLLQFKPEWGIPHCLFLNAQNKQTIATIVRPLRELGIPVAGVFDIDALKEGGAVWTNLLTCAGIPAMWHEPLATMRGKLKAAFDQSGHDMKRDGGLDILEQTDRNAAQDLWKQLEAYGLFLVPGGEVESWLKDLKVTGHGPTWLIAVFEKMGSDPTLASYVRPNEADVWKFFSRIREWLVNPDRLGIPD
jgi:hypothetical protein